MTKDGRTIQEKMAALDALVAWFSSDEFILEQAVEKFKEAELLAAEIDSDLAKLKNDITVVKQKFDAQSGL